jgi:hypothetical protein
VPLTGCGSNFFQTSYERHYPISAELVTQVSSCEFAPNQGSEAEFIKLEHTQLSLSDFNKEFNRSHFDGILSASGDSTIDYVGRDSVQLFKAPVEGDGCKYFAKARLIPNDWLDFWSGVAAVLGVYVGKTMEQLQKFKTEEPVIIVREQAGRWVLVHEYLHHLFYTESLKNGHNDQKLRAERDTLLDKYLHLSYENAFDFTTLSEVVDTFTQFVHSNDKMLLHYFYEEIAVENLLRKEFESGHLKFVSQKDYENAAWYIHYSADNSVRMTNVLTENLIAINLQLEKSTELNDGQKENLTGKVKSALQLIDERTLQLNEILKVTPKVTTFNNEGGIASSVHKDLFSSCEHNQVEKKFIDRAVKALARSL